MHIHFPHFKPAQRAVLRNVLGALLSILLALLLIVLMAILLVFPDSVFPRPVDSAPTHARIIPEALQIIKIDLLPARSSG